MRSAAVRPEEPPDPQAPASSARAITSGRRARDLGRRMAEEIKAYLALTDEAQAAAFIDSFWARRNPTPGKPNPLRKAFDERVLQADHNFSEAGYRGRRTDRGTLYILYGPPGKTDFDVSPEANGPPLEVWLYTPTTPEGLDGKRPNLRYRFIKKGDLTVLYVPGQDPRLRTRMDSAS